MALEFLMELIVQDVSLPKMAEELNRRRFRMRDGSPWTAVAVFERFSPAGGRGFAYPFQ